LRQPDSVSAVDFPSGGVTPIHQKGERVYAQSPSFRQPYVLLEPKLDCFSRNTLICKSIWFCEILMWNSAESRVFDVSRQLNVLHQAASCSSCYDIRDIAIHDRFRPSWGSSGSRSP
ncbi:hypothetical protein CSKR_108993, partial [Clonorchis sinensis]